MRVSGLVVSCALVLVAGGLTARAQSSKPATMTPRGVDAVRLGTAKTQTVRALTSLFGRSTKSGVNTACGSRYTEVAWNDFVAEFRDARFSGYRYLVGGYPLTAGSPRPITAGPISPDLVTATGITLLSRLSQLKSAYPGLRHVGASKWQANNGLMFVDNAKHDPEPASSRITEIKFKTCGDY
jgi:hypothetical protein